MSELTTTTNLAAAAALTTTAALGTFPSAATATATATTTTISTNASLPCRNIDLEAWPTNETACAVPNTPALLAAMKTCCHGAPVTPFDNNCVIYCPVQNQSVGELVDCLIQHGVVPGDTFCKNPYAVSSAPGEGSTPTTIGVQTPTTTATTTAAAGTATSTPLRPGTSAGNEVVNKSGLVLLMLVMGSVTAAFLL